MVARPMGVTPTTIGPLAMKCSDQACWRGLNSETTAPSPNRRENLGLWLNRIPHDIIWSNDLEGIGHGAAGVGTTSVCSQRIDL